MVKALYAEFVAKVGADEELARRVAELTDAVRQEPGNVAFVPYRLEEDPRRWFVYEVYQDEDAFRAHITAPHSDAFNAVLPTLIEGDGSVLTWLTPTT
ncbi:MAG: antibiotic biosynthesis monooxygenase [Naasia sp.]|jgi:quinol monooxygenase YgiN|uniref:putative quinol monooxygenase n=1 Tax=Naasia sp. TaxID=2546198 RepID=UPI002604B7BA|nr:putative quinol monooxygenase [Naasia sp.]MCU1570237.1 antibiotic biosynthesis monooxygenase [Naasia sp.]